MGVVGVRQGAPLKPQTKEATAGQSVACASAVQCATDVVRTKQCSPQPVTLLVKPQSLEDILQGMTNLLGGGDEAVESPAICQLGSPAQTGIKALLKKLIEALMGRMPTAWGNDSETFDEDLNLSIALDLFLMDVEKLSKQEQLNKLQEVAKIAKKTSKPKIAKTLSDKAKKIKLSIENPPEALRVANQLIKKATHMVDVKNVDPETAREGANIIFSALDYLNDEQAQSLLNGIGERFMGAPNAEELLAEFEKKGTQLWKKRYSAMKEQRQLKRSQANHSSVRTT